MPALRGAVLFVFWLRVTSACLDNQLYSSTVRVATLRSTGQLQRALLQGKKERALGGVLLRVVGARSGGQAGGAALVRPHGKPDGTADVLAAADCGEAGGLLARRRR